MKHAGKKNVDEFTQIILDSITDGVFTVDLEWKITSFNSAAEKITGINREDAIGKYCCDVFRTNICEKDCALRDTIKTGKPWVNKTVYIVDADGLQVPVSISTAILRDEKSNVIGGVETFRDLSVVNELRKELEEHYSFCDIISKNKEIKQIFNILPQIAESESTVLIQGESGTGKELFARVIHNLSKRKNEKMIAVNCSALPDTLLESELFGYKAGAFTDAKKDRKGRFAQAEGGTILLDEIGDITPALQVRLLRVLQEKTYEPLGATHSERADVRVIAATNKNLGELTQRGEFRQDLYYRINVIKIVLPPLRDHKEDIPLLIRHFITKFNRLHDKNIDSLSPKAMQVLMRHDYPGNIRELENIIEHSFVLCRNSIIAVEHLPQDLQPKLEYRRQILNEPDTFETLQTQFILDVLERNGWNRLRTAEVLGIHKSTLFRKIKQLGIKLPKQDGRSSRMTDSHS